MGYSGPNRQRRRSLFSTSTATTNTVEVLQAALSKVGMNLGVFEKLVNSASPVSLNDLVSETGAAPKMLGTSHIISDGVY